MLPSKSLVWESICFRLVSNSEPGTTFSQDNSIKPVRPASEARMSWLAVAKAWLLFVSRLAALAIVNTKLNVAMNIMIIIPINIPNPLFLTLLTKLTCPFCGTAKTYTWNMTASHNPKKPKLIITIITITTSIYW